MADLVLGPMLRYVGATSATVWVETDEPCGVEVLGAREQTFNVAGHHFALVCVEGLEPGTTTPYEVALDGETRWPLPDSRFPPSVVRTQADGDPLLLAFGSCRVCVPHVAPWSDSKDDDDCGREVDALRAYALRMRELEPEAWPHALLLLGDQVYADQVSPQTAAFIRTRRDTTQGAGEEIADFEEYTRLYREAWSEPTMRWLFSTVATCMIFDDHDVHDDWNTSRDWVETMRAKPWWEERIVGAFGSYWCYQHLGNLSPEHLADDDLYAQVRHAEDDVWPQVRAFSHRADRETDGAQWSYRRDFGSVRLVMIDSRAGRVLEPGRRAMVDEDEWAWIEQHARGDCDHLLLGTSLPWLSARGMHGLEAWNEAVAEGAWGRRASRLGEKLRQALDMEHWAAFNASFRRLCELVEEVGAGRRGEAPVTIVALSGDVHHAYLSRARPGDHVRSRIYQAVCSPFRNPLDTHERRAIKAAESRIAGWLMHLLARSAGVPEPPWRWARVHGEPFFDNQVATLHLEGHGVTMRVEKTTPGTDDPPRLDEVFRHEL